MKRILGAAAITAASTSFAMAGGIDRSGQSIGIIFEEGSYGEVSLGFVNPNVSGVGSVFSPTPGQASGNMSPDYSQLSFGYKQDINDQLSFALIFDQPYGADVNYPATTTYFARGSVAEASSNAITGILRYKFNENVSVHAGLRYQSFEASATVPFVAGYAATGQKDWSVGYLAGVAYERSDIALRVALTYYSGIDHDLATTETGPVPGTSTTSFETPQAVNLDFQTGIAEDTLLFGSIRWVEWSNFRIAPVGYGIATGGGALVSFANDTTTYNIGVGRRFNENWSGAISLGYEKENGGFSSNLGPTDGNISLGLGGTYTNGNVKVTGGVRYIKIGNAQTTLGGGVPASNFSGNKAIGAGIRIGYSF